MNPAADVERAAKRFKEIVEILGKNYLSSMVANGLIPVITDALLECLSDAKKDAGVGPETIEERLRYNEEEKEPDMFLINVDNDTIMSTRYNSSFMAYDVWAVRIGVKNREDKEAKRKPFFAMGQKHRVRYEQLAKVPGKVRKDFPEAKLPEFPPPYRFGGTCCCGLIKQQSGNRYQHKEAITTFFEAVNHDYPSKEVANHFKVGANWKVQQAMQEVFLQAFIATKRTVLRHSFSWELYPYDAHEALVQLLQAVADDEIIPDMVLKIPGPTPGCCRYTMISNIRRAVFTAIDTAAAGWTPLSDVADKAGEKVGEAIKEGADKLVEAVKPILKKILGMVQEKMNEGKSDAGETKEDTEAKLGDIVAAWQFQKTGPGAKFYEDLVSKSPKTAFAAVASDITNALVAAIKNPIDALLEKILGGNLASNPFVQAAVEGLVRRVVYKIQTFATITPFIDAGQVFAPIVDKIEEDLVALAGKGEGEFNGAIDAASTALWKGLGNMAMNLFTSTFRLEERCDRSGESEAAMEPMLFFLRHMFVTQMRAFNAIRVTLINNLRGKFAAGGDADSIRGIVRTEVRNAIFEITNILVHEMYMSGQLAMTTSAKVVVIDKFMENVWPHIAAPLNDLAAELPDVLKNFGLDVVALAETIVRILIGKLVGAVMNKVFMKIEEVVFSQA